METIDQTIDDFRAVVAQADVDASVVSQWNVGMHIHHCCLAMIGISKGLAKSTPPVPRMRPSIARYCAFAVERFPRGQAKSPTFAVPAASAPQEELLALLDRSQKMMVEARALDADRWVTHPIFGPLRRDDALKFVRIHNRHHLRIVADILRRARS